MSYQNPKVTQDPEGYKVRDDPYESYHMSMCIHNKIEEMNDPIKCTSYLAGRLYNASRNAGDEKVAGKILDTNMGQLHDTCERINKKLPLSFYVDLCKGVNQAYGQTGSSSKYREQFLNPATDLYKSK